MNGMDIDVALSFAGEDRAYAAEVAHALRDAGVRVFYDQFEMVDLFGQNLVVCLEEVYRKRARYVAVFVSKHYARRKWTTFERNVIHSRLLEGEPDCLLPVRLDETQIPGILPTISFVDGRDYTSQQVAALIGAKVAAGSVHEPVLEAPIGIPTTVDAKVRLVSYRPPGWEHLLLAGVIWQAAEVLEPERMDLELAYAGSTGEHVSARQVLGRINVWLDELTAIAGRLAALFEPARLMWAVGQAGDPGDATRIEHLGRRFAEAYGELLDWRRRVAGAAAELEILALLARLARLADRPVHQTRAFVNDLVNAAAAIAAGYVENGPVATVPVSLALDLDSHRLNDFLARFSAFRETAS
jgi:hypothetical protein